MATLSAKTRQVTILPTAEELLEASRAAMELSFSQMLIGLVEEGWITEAEGDAWLVGTLPTAVTSLIDSLPASERFAARARASAPSVVLRMNPLVLGLAAVRGATLGQTADETAAELDTFFITYSGV